MMRVLFSWKGTVAWIDTHYFVKALYMAHDRVDWNLFPDKPFRSRLISPLQVKQINLSVHYVSFHAFIIYLKFLKHRVGHMRQCIHTGNMVICRHTFTISISLLAIYQSISQPWYRLPSNNIPLWAFTPLLCQWLTSTRSLTLATQ